MLGGCVVCGCVVWLRDAVEWQRFGWQRDEWQRFGWRRVERQRVRKVQCSIVGGSVRLYYVVAWWVAAWTWCVGA